MENCNCTKSALETEVVLEHLLWYLSVPDLYFARQVCRVWNQEAISHLKKRSRSIYLIGTEEMDKLIRCSAQSSSGDFPISKVHLDMVLMYWNRDFEEDILNRLMGSSWLSTLQVSVPSFYYLQNFPGKILPNLKTFGFHADEYGCKHHTFCVQIVEKAPKLTALMLNPRKIHSSLLDQLSQVKGLQLKELSLEYRTFPFGPLSLEEEAEYSRGLLHLLESQQKSLHKLQLILEGKQKIEVPNLVLPELENLSLSWGEWGNGFQDSLQYAHSFPALRVLRLAFEAPRLLFGAARISELSDWESGLWKQNRASGLTHLSLTGLEDPASQKLFQENMPTAFPALTKLEIENCDKVVWSVLELMSAFGKLEELSLPVEGISGLTMALTAGGTTEEMEEEEWCHKTETEPYSTLKRLRRLKVTFQFERLCVSSSLSISLCRLLGILTPNLKTLHLVLAKERLLGPRPLPPWMADLERKTTIIFN